MYGSRLTRDYGDSVPDAWRTAINQLKQHEVTRGLQRLLRQGHATPPTLPQFVKACREIGGGEDGQEPHPAPDRALPSPQYEDPIHRHAQLSMFGYLWSRGAASQDSLSKMITAKNKLVAQFQDIYREDKTITGSEIRDALFKAWDKVWQPIPENEANRHALHVQRTGYAADWMQSSGARAA
jgi:hypothetical protein